MFVVVICYTAVPHECEDCDYNAYCGVSQCVCNEGYYGDGFLCQALDCEYNPNVIRVSPSQGRLQEFGLWYAHMMPKSGGDYNLTVISQSKQWIYNIHNLFII